MTIKVSKSEFRLLLLALNLGSEWESSLADGLGDEDAAYRRKTIKSSERMLALRQRLITETKG